MNDNISLSNNLKIVDKVSRRLIQLHDIHFRQINKKIKAKQ